MPAKSQKTNKTDNTKKLREENLRLVSELNLMRELTSGINHTSYEEAVSWLMELLKKVVPYTAFSLAILDDEESIARLYTDSPAEETIDRVKNTVAKLLKKRKFDYRIEMETLPEGGVSLSNEGDEFVMSLKSEGEMKGFLILTTPQPLSEDEGNLLNSVSKPIAAIIDNVKVYTRLQDFSYEKETLLSLMNNVGEIVGSMHNLDQLLAMVMDLLLGISGAEVGSIMLYEDGVLNTHISYGLDDDVAKLIRTTEGKPVVEAAAELGELTVIEDFSADPRLEKREIPNVLINSYLSIPLKDQNGVVGIVNIVNLPKGSFTKELTDSLLTVGSLAASSIRNAKLYLELKQTQDQLIQSAKLASLGEMAAGIAHEVRNPLTSIRGYADLIYKSLPEDDKIKDYSKVVVDEVKRLNNIVKNILDFARKVEPEVESTNLNDLVEGLIVLVEKDSSYNMVEIKLDLDPDLPAVMADSTQVKQVFLNLTQNAIQAMPDGGELVIASKRIPGQVEISFIDKGLGMPPEQIAKIFDPFFTTKDEGTGLGLSVSYRIIENHRGGIEVTSEVGAGTTFKVRLPVGNTS